MSILKPIAALVGLAAAGFGGFNLMTTGCVLGACSTDANTSLVSTTAGDCSDSGCCPLTTTNTTTVADAGSDCADACGDSCDSEGTLVAGKSDCAESCDAPCSMGASTLVADTKDCATSCDTACDGEKSGGVALQLVSTEVVTEGSCGSSCSDKASKSTAILTAAETCTDKTDCSDKVDCETSCEKDAQLAVSTENGNSAEG
ncbi:MAG: hypothetical protein AAF747_01360 [Planctomycetota bacterium]